MCWFDGGQPEIVVSVFIKDEEPEDTLRITIKANWKYSLGKNLLDGNNRRKLEGTSSQLAGSSWVSNPLIQPFKTHRKILQPAHKCPWNARLLEITEDNSQAQFRNKLDINVETESLQNNEALFWKPFHFDA